MCDGSSLVGSSFLDLGKAVITGDVLSVMKLTGIGGVLGASIDYIAAWDRESVWKSLANELREYIWQDESREEILNECEELLKKSIT